MSELICFRVPDVHGEVCHNIDADIDYPIGPAVAQPFSAKSFVIYFYPLIAASEGSPQRDPLHRVG